MRRRGFRLRERNGLAVTSRSSGDEILAPAFGALPWIKAKERKDMAAEKAEANNPHQLLLAAIRAAKSDLAGRVADLRRGGGFSPSSMHEQYPAVPRGGSRQAKMSNRVTSFNAGREEIF
jgi:hypothetical protein